MYMIFLSFFLYHTLAGRTHAFYYTQYARDVVDVDKFMLIDDPVKYRDWLEYRFLPGMHWNGIDRSAGGTPGIVLVGPPRVRAVRAKTVRSSHAQHSAVPPRFGSEPFLLCAGVRRGVEAHPSRGEPPVKLRPRRGNGSHACALLRPERR